MNSLNVNDIPFEEKSLHIPSLEEVKAVLAKGLQSNFKEVTVEVVDSPDFHEAPFHLAGSGFSGSPLLIEVGGPPYLLPLVDRSKVYDLRAISRKICGNAGDLLAVGAGAGPYPLIDSNCEAIFNVKYNADGTVLSNTHISSVNRVTDGEGKCDLARVPETDTRFALLGNIFVSQGKPGKVVRVHCKQRSGSDDFITSIRNSLTSHFNAEDKIVGLGGVFLLKKGSARQHVMRDFSKTPIHTEEQLNDWLKFYEMPATLIALGTLVTDEADMDLRLQHFHSFSTHGWGGHYHNDTTPDIAEYEGYFNVAEKVVRVDKPINTHKMGRD